MQTLSFVLVPNMPKAAASSKAMSRIVFDSYKHYSISCYYHHHHHFYYCYCCYYYFFYYYYYNYCYNYYY